MLTTNIQVTKLSPQNMDVVGNGFARNYKMLPSTKQFPIPSIPIQMIVLIFSVLLCIFSCLLTVTLSYKWHVDTNQSINRLVGTVEDAIRDLNTFTDIVRYELVAKHVSNTYKDQHKSKTDGNDYEEVAEDYDEGDRFMGKDLMDNNWPANQYHSNESNKSKTRERRNAVIDATTIVKNELNSSKNGKAGVERIQEKNTVKTYRRQKSKKIGELYEDFKETPENAAAHFISDSSKYSTKIHPHYNGNGRLKHPDGDFRDWTQHRWGINLNNSNHFIMKNGKVEVLKPGLYFVYAQIYYSDKHDINGYYIMKNDEKILGCTSTRHQDNQASDSCYTGGLIYFNSKDNLSIRGLDSDRFIILDPVRSFFGLFRLSKDDTMGVCFICDTKLYGERTRVCSSITPHSNVSYPEKIAELIGDEAVVIVTPNDYICKKCNSLLTHMDKTENDLKLVKNAMLSYIQKKYGLLPPDHTFKDVNIVNGHLEAEDQLEQGQRKVSSGLTIGVSSTVTTAALVMPVQTPLKLLKTQQQPQQQQQQQPQQQQQQQPQQQQQQQPPTQQENTNKMKVYKCGFCTFQSKDLGHVRFHMRNHVNKKEPEKPILNQATDKELTPVPQQKRRIYRCQVCSKSFNCRIDCLDHIQKDHNQLTPSTSNAKRGTEDSCPVITKVMKPEPPKAQENNQQAESPMDVDKNQQDNIKGTVDMDMMLNDHVPSEGSADVEQKEETENSQEDKTVKEAKSEIKPEPAHEKATEEEEDTAALGQEEVDQETPDSIKKEYDEENENVENKTEDLDIESMLAAIHNDNPNNNEDTQNKA